MEFAIETKGLSKKFKDIFALYDVNFQLKKGSIHAIVGENGAGKTTLAKIICGLERQTDGEVLINGCPAASNYEKMKEKGIGIVFQEINLIPSLNAIENIFLNKKDKNLSGSINVANKINIVKKLFSSVGLKIEPSKTISEMDVVSQKMIEIIRVIHSNAKVIILDEVTGALNDLESVKLYKMLKKLSLTGVSIIFISHKLNDILVIADEITILRNGRQVKTVARSAFNLDGIISSMSHTRFVNRYPRLKIKIGAELLRLDNITSIDSIHNVSLELHRGEILGVFSLAGSGLTALAELIAGMRKKTTGYFYIDGEKLSDKNYIATLNKKIAYASENPALQLVQHMDVAENITVSRLKGVTEKGIINRKTEIEIAEEYKKMLGYSNVNIRMHADELSTGTQAKVLMSKLLYSNAKILLINNITKNLDIISKMCMYNIFNEILLANIGIILISSNLDELMGMCNKILVLFKGSIVAEIGKNQIDERIIVSYAMGLNGNIDWRQAHG